MSKTEVVLIWVINFVNGDKNGKGLLTKMVLQINCDIHLKFWTCPVPAG